MISNEKNNEIKTVCNAEIAVLIAEDENNLQRMLHQLNIISK